MEKKRKKKNRKKGCLGTSPGSTAVAQARDDSVLDLRGDSKNEKKWRHSEIVSEVESN